MIEEQREVDKKIESEIIHTLKGIGFPESLDSWRDSPAVIDPDGQTLRILGHPVMERWEEPYMKRLAEIATSNAKGGTILELGFGLGISAKFIQAGAPKHHVIIEMNKAIAESARLFANQQNSQVTILEGFWQDLVPQLASESFQGILFDTYPLSEEEVDTIFYPFLEHAYRLLAYGGVLTYYSDEPAWFSQKHLTALHDAGFTKINGSLCEISPPADCQYWKQSTILAPIIEK
jgi:guanidinoacetate N-methyltransferase